MISVGAVLIALFVGFKYTMPARVNPEQITLAQATFKRVYALVYLLWLLTAAALAALFYFLLTGINPAPKEFLYDLYPDNPFWIAVSAVLGLSLGILAVFGLVRLMLKAQFNDFWSMYDQRYAFRATVILKVLTVLLASVGLTLIVLGKNACFKISPEKIVVSRLFEWSSREYPVRAITEIIHVQLPGPEDNETFKPYYELVFSDGYRWNTRMDMREPQDSDDRVFEQIAEFAGTTIREAR